jgi:molybdopterin-guanine dinucleotide biosynthesis protein A
MCTGVTSIVLAGGKNLRLGRRKDLEIIGGKTLMELVIQKLKLVSSHTLIVTSREQSNFPDAGGAKVLVDLYPDKGPLGGIYTGLLASPSSCNVVVACDMPFLNIELLRYMIELLPGFDAVVPRLEEDKLEPLHAIYSKSCLDKMRIHLENDQLMVNRFLGIMNVRYVEQAECQRLDPQLLTFFNVNCQADLDRASWLARSESKYKNGNDSIYWPKELTIDK